MDPLKYAMVQLISPSQREWSKKILYLPSGPFFIAYAPPSFPLDVSADTIDKAIREEFNLPNDVNYSLVDTADNAIVDRSAVKYLNDESQILIRIKSIENRSQ